MLCDTRLLANPNADDGDRAFASGAASNRTDVFSELDADYGSLGVRFSGAFWYDPVYFNRTANNSPATFNPFTVPNDKFTRSVRTLEGLNAELLDGFVYPAHARTRKSLGEMMRKLSVTSSQ